MSAPAALIQHSDSNIYGYVPTTWICAIFVTLYGISTLAHVGQAIKTRTWFMFGTVIFCGLAELIGWSARLWSSRNILALTPFLMQISTTIFAPTFTAAANFIILGSIIKRVGPQYSRLQAYSFGIIFISIDVAALIVQAVGGGVASSAPGLASTGQPAAQQDPHAVSPQGVQGGHIMLGGIVVQLAEILVSLGLAAEFFWNYYARRVVRDLPSEDPALTSGSMAKAGDVEKGPGGAGKKGFFGARRGGGPAMMRQGSDETAVEQPHTPVEPTMTPGKKGSWKHDVAVERRMSTRLIVMSWAFAFSSLCLLIRSIYRTIELSNGWNGRIIETQLYFNVLDGAMVVLSMYTLNFFHPGWFLYSDGKGL